MAEPEGLIRSSRNEQKVGCLIICKNTSLPPAYGVRREGYVLTPVCLSVHRGVRVKGQSSQGGVRVKGQSSRGGGGGGQGQRSIQLGGRRGQGQGSGSKVNPVGGGGVSGSKVNPAGGQGQRSIQLGGQGQRSIQPGGQGQRSIQLGGGRSKVNPAGGQVKGQSSPGGSASCALLRAVCLLRSRRRTFLLLRCFELIASFGEIDFFISQKLLTHLEPSVSG